MLFLLAALTLDMAQNLCCCGEKIKKIKKSVALCSDFFPRLIPRTHHAFIVISEACINEVTEQLIAGDTLYSYCKRFKLQNYRNTPVSSRDTMQELTAG